MSEPVRDRKTQPTDADVEAYLATIPDEARRADAREAVRELIARGWATNHID